jgi:glutathione peroxidase
MKSIAIGLIVLGTISVYVAIVNRNNKHSSVKQKILKAFYPAIMKMGKTKSVVLVNQNNTQPFIDFYSLSFLQIDGTPFSMQQLKGKKVLLVNTASDCGFTGQYESLEKLYQKHKEKLVIIGFPANDFNQQEKGSNTTIQQFCQKNYGVSFPLAEKGVVAKKESQQQIFQWLSQEEKNGWCNQQPSWNFCKYLIDENGVLTHFFSSSVDPLGKEITNALQ